LVASVGLARLLKVSVHDDAWKWLDHCMRGQLPYTTIAVVSLVVRALLDMSDSIKKFFINILLGPNFIKMDRMGNISIRGSATNAIKLIER